MKNESKRSILEAILNSQDLGKKDVDTVLYCFDNDISLPVTIDPLTQFIFNTINAEEEGSGIETTIDYGINQLRRAKQALSEQRLSLFDHEAIN